MKRSGWIIKKSDAMVNLQIRDSQVRLIDSDGSMLGIMSSKEAQRIAESRNLDLVKIAPKAEPPVCRIMDYGKYSFELAKREREAKKNQKIVMLKEVRISAKIDEHDYNFKAKNAQKFLEDGDKVKVTIRFRGREMQHTDLGRAMLERFTKTLEEYGTVEKKPYLEGKSMFLILAPK